MYEFTAFYLYKAVFMAELVVAEFLTAMRLHRRALFPLRALLVVALDIGFAFALPVFSYSAVYCAAVFILMFAFSVLTMKICYEDNAVTVIFRGIMAYSLQHIAFQIFDLVSLGIGALMGLAPSIGAYGSGEATEFFIIVQPRAFGASSAPSVTSELQMLFTYCAYFFIYLGVYALGYSYYNSRLKDSDKIEMKSSVLFVFVVCFVVINILVSSVVTYYSEQHFDMLYVVLLALYNIAGSAFVVYLMLELVFRRQLEKDFSIANRLLKESARQYELAKRNIELINLKCHDLKYRIRSSRLAGETGGEAIAEIENMISIYDSTIRTGNDALDVILTEKSLTCNGLGIKLYCIVDGALLSFMSEADLYSLFGNVLDNAIEAVTPLEGGKRFINLSVKAVNGFVRISEHNCYSAGLEFDDGLPKSTKKGMLHGYGMKSIRLICQRYDGEMNVSAEDGSFELDLVFMR